MWKRTPRRTTMSPPVHLTEPLPPPQAVPGCEACEVWAGGIRRAREDGALTRETDCKVLLRRHLAARHGGKR